MKLRAEKARRQQEEAELESDEEDLDMEEEGKQVKHSYENNPGAQDES